MTLPLVLWCKILEIYLSSWFRLKLLFKPKFCIFISYPIFSIPDPVSRVKNTRFKYFLPKKLFLSSRNYDPVCSSRIPDPDLDFYPSWIPDSGSRNQKGTRNPDPDSQHRFSFYVKQFRLTGSFLFTIVSITEGGLML